MPARDLSGLEELSVEQLAKALELMVRAYDLNQYNQTLCWEIEVVIKQLEDKGGKVPRRLLDR